MKYKNNWNYINCFDWFDEGTKKIMCLTDKNAFCEVDEETKTARVIGKYPNNDVSSSDLSRTLTELEDKIIFTPFYADSIAVYDKALSSLKFIDISKVCDKRTEFIDVNGLFATTIRWKNYIYMFGWCYPAILRYDVQNESILVIDDWVEDLKMKMGNNPVRYYFANGYVQQSNIFILPLCCLNGLLIFNADSMDCNIILISSQANGFWGITEFQNKLWLSDFAGISTSLTRVDLKSFVGDDLEFFSKQEGIISLFAVDDALYGISLSGKGFHKWDRQLRYIGRKNYPWNQKETIYTAKVDSSDLWIVENNTRKWYRYSLKNGNYEEYKYEIVDNEYLEESWKLREKELFDKTQDGMLIEGTLGLDGFIRELIRR